MGYDTTLVFVDGWNNKLTGFAAVIATVDLAVTGSGEYQTLRERKKKQTIERLGPQNMKLLREYEHLMDIRSERDLTPNEKERGYKLIKYLSSKLPSIHIEDGNWPNHSDRYGDPLFFMNIDDVYYAILHDNQKLIDNREQTDGRGYRRFEIALGLMDKFRDKRDWTKVKVVHFGH